MTEKKPEEQNQEAPTSTMESVEEVNTSSLIDRANDAAQRLEEGNKQLAELLKKQEQMYVENKLGGSTVAGVSQKSKEEQEIESAKNFIKGSGFEDDIF